MTRKWCDEFYSVYLIGDCIVLVQVVTVAVLNMYVLYVHASISTLWVRTYFDTIYVWFENRQTMGMTVLFVLLLYDFSYYVSSGKRLNCVWMVVVSKYSVIASIYELIEWMIYIHIHSMNLPTLRVVTPFSEHGERWSLRWPLLIRAFGLDV